MQHVYNYAELAEATLQVSESPIRLGVIGNPISHSKSPQMQQAALDERALPYTYVRMLCSTEEGAFEQFLSLLQQRSFIGANVTVPFKKKAFTACIQTDPLAQLCQAVNTLVWREDGWHGYNTDGPGFAQAILQFTAQELSELRIVILGACGGAGSALACQCALKNSPSLTLVNRPKPQLHQLRDLLCQHSEGHVKAMTFQDPALADAISQADLVVNATSLGLKEGEQLPLNPDWLNPAGFVYDIVTHNTALQRAAETRGCRTDNGLAMLLWQGAYAFRHWFGIMPQVKMMEHALLHS